MGKKFVYIESLVCGTMESDFCHPFPTLGAWNSEKKILSLLSNNLLGSIFSSQWYIKILWCKIRRRKEVKLAYSVLSSQTYVPVHVADKLGNWLDQRNSNTVKCQEIQIKMTGRFTNPLGKRHLWSMWFQLGWQKNRASR